LAIGAVGFKGSSASTLWLFCLCFYLVGLTLWLLSHLFKTSSKQIIYVISFLSAVALLGVESQSLDVWGARWPNVLLSSILMGLAVFLSFSPFRGGRPERNNAHHQQLLLVFGLIFFLKTIFSLALTWYFYSNHTDLENVRYLLNFETGTALVVKWSWGILFAGIFWITQFLAISLRQSALPFWQPLLTLAVSLSEIISQYLDIYKNVLA
jgi:hypothetical protein